MLSSPRPIVFEGVKPSNQLGTKLHHMFQIRKGDQGPKLLQIFLQIHHGKTNQRKTVKRAHLLAWKFQA